MKKYILLGIGLLFTLPFFAQVAQIGVMTTQREIGKNYRTGEVIRANEYHFPERIYSLSSTEDGTHAIIQFRNLSRNGKKLENNGNIWAYNLADNYVKWSLPADYQANVFEVFDGGLLQVNLIKTTYIDGATGIEKWTEKKIPYGTSSDKKVWWGYRQRGSAKTINTLLEGADLDTGAKLWERKINREYGWSQVEHLNDSVLFIVAEGLHTLNIRTGEGWDYQAAVGRKYYTGGIAAVNALGIVTGLLTGVFVITTGAPQKESAASNVGIDDSHIYFASQEELICLTLNGEKVWSYKIPNKYASSSWLLLRDNSIILVNKGYANNGSKRVNMGMPFVASFDKETGQQVFFGVSLGEDDQINGYKVTDSLIYVTFNDRIAVYDNKTGFLHEKMFDTKQTGDLHYFPEYLFYIAADDLYMPLADADSKKHFVGTQNGFILKINDRLEIEQQYESKDFYKLYDTYGDYKFLLKDKNMTVIDAGGQKIADLDIPEMGLSGNRLYYSEKNVLTLIDLNDFLHE